MSLNKKNIVALVSEFPPPAAGMTVLAEEIYSRFKDEKYPIIKVRTNPELKIFSWINNIRVLRTIYKWLIFLVHCLKLLKSDVIHVFSSSGLNFILFTVPVVIIADLTSKKVIINYHGGAAKEYFTKHPKILNFVMRRINVLVVPSGYLKKVFKDFGYDSIIIPNFSNTKRFNFIKRNTFEPVVISVRNFTSTYNIECAIKAFSILQKKYPEAVFYLAGDGPEKKNIISLINKLKLNNVKLLGNISNEKIPYYFDKSSVFINTSNVDNMPGSILEAFASGLPVVSTNVGGIPYMVKHHESGLLANANDFEKLGDYLIQIVSNDNSSIKYVKKGREYLSALSWPSIKNSWIDLYENIH